MKKLFYLFRRALSFPFEQGSEYQPLVSCSCPAREESVKSISVFRSLLGRSLLFFPGQKTIPRRQGRPEDCCEGECYEKVFSVLAKGSVMSLRTGMRISVPCVQFMSVP